MTDKIDLPTPEVTHFLCIYPAHQMPAVQYLCALQTVIKHFKEYLSPEQIKEGFNYLFLETNKP